MELTEFLLARIAEDERAARAAADRIPLMYHPDVLRVDYGLGIAQSQHIARHNPARVLAECESKRRMLVTLVAAHEASSAWITGDRGAILTTTEALLRLLGLPYVDHPDYRDEWRP